MALRNIRERRLRSSLTILGIVIGIAAVVSLISTGIGATEFIQGQLGQFGANRLFISASSTGGGGGPVASTQQLTQHDADAIKNVKGIDTVVGVVFVSFPVKYNNEDHVLSVIGVDPKEARQTFGQIQGFQLDEGRFLQEGEKFSVNIGPTIATKTFSKDVTLGSKIEIDGVKFKVVGITKATGQQNNDNLLAIPIDTLRSMTGDKENHFSVLLASVNDINRIDDIAKSVQKKLDDLHGKKVFGVLTTSQLVSNISAIFGSLSVLLTGIAAISLIVAAVGISNTMLMTILERTREIGTMKAIGASNYNIIQIFLTESALIGLAGGIIGVALGFIAAQAINGASGLFGFPLRTSVPPYLAAGGVGLAVLVGVASGLWPAIRAAKLNPVEALRYE